MELCDEMLKATERWITSGDVVLSMTGDKCWKWHVPHWNRQAMSSLVGDSVSRARTLGDVNLAKLIFAGEE